MVALNVVNILWNSDLEKHYHHHYCVLGKKPKNYQALYRHVTQSYSGKLPSSLVHLWQYIPLLTIKQNLQVAAR
jgi:uncharacterized membrane-anchored protein YhcB (DUF1043 family)